MQMYLTEIYTNAWNEFIYCAMAHGCLYLYYAGDNNIISLTGIVLE